MIQERVDQERAKGKKSGLDTLIELRDLALGYASKYQPAPTGMPPNPQADEKKFLIYIKLAGDWAAEMAEYQHPKLRAIAVAMPPPFPPPRLVEGNVIDMPLDTIGLSRLYQKLVNGKP